MNKNLIKTTSFWITLGILSGVLFLNLSFSKSLPDILESTSPSVVNIWSIKKWKAWQEKSSILGMKRWRQVIKTGFVPNGSGVIVSKDGMIITNFHVINDAFKNNQKLVVEFSNGNTSEALIIGFDLDADVAVIKIISDEIFFPIKIRKNIDNLRVGETVIAVGNPQGLGQSFSIGIVSAINRQFKNKNGSFIQTDASINPGNSGGALIDKKGRLVGITNFIESTSGGSQGLNFAIPIDVVMESFELISN
ncbi:trypsin-like peptidase domain-containing protein [SAR86 cluster bacterium]|nr:trypsin-like peptidase domain-containing protein [SAR86 cluster bacterium]